MRLAPSRRQAARASKAARPGRTACCGWSGLIQDDRVARSLPAAGTALYQTPQACAHGLLLAAMEQAAADRVSSQSVLELMMRAGHEVRVVPGEKLNIKFTTSEDWRLAQCLLKQLA